ncbi:hypothetical protein Ddye_021819 [Dipteronia dyeriana]|uniref:Uncharacterized protein n=1 Tax=Dipteronia dyeriana TaxID=168575 RepID=A0AAD9U3E6_9ROSI|nr:hypothetical protein Ddye_021819 [Dipteronia dyeriana]
MTRPSSVVLASLLALSLLITGAQGIRFKIGGLLSFGHDHHLEPAEIHELKKMMKTSHEDGSVIGESITGMITNRKLITTANTTSETNIGENKAHPRASSSKSKSSSDDRESNSPPPATTCSEHSSNDEISHDHYHVDITDITEMDYSPARRKPPIHN